MIKTKSANVKAVLKKGDSIELKYGEWGGLGLDIVELDCGYSLDFNSDTQPISMLKSLKKLTMYATSIDNLSFAISLSQLEVLECGINNIVDLTPLTNLKLLKKLRLAENSIEDLGPLENLDNLIELDVSDNCVKSLAPIAKLKNLKIIDFVYQRPLIKDLTPLKQLKDLKIAMVGGHPVSYDELKSMVEKNKNIAGLFNGDHKI